LDCDLPSLFRQPKLDLVTVTIGLVNFWTGSLEVQMGPTHLKSGLSHGIDRPALQSGRDQNPGGPRCEVRSFAFD